MTTSTTMSNTMKFAAVATVIGVAAIGSPTDANATCIKNGQPSACPPVPPPISSPPPAPTPAPPAPAPAPTPAPAPAPVYNNNPSYNPTNTTQSAAEAAAAATAAAQAAAAAQSASRSASESDATGGNAAVKNEVVVNQNEVKQKFATPLVAPGLTSSLSQDGCVAISSISLGGSVVGAGAATLAFTTGAALVKDCPEAIRKTAVVIEGIRSDDPAKNVLGYRAAGMQADLTYLSSDAGIKDQGLFGKRGNSAGGTPITVVLNGAAAPIQAPTTPSLTPCKGLNKKGEVVQGEWIQVGKDLICKMGGDSFAPTVK